MEDVVFTFNSKPFLMGINSVAGGFRMLKNVTSGFLEGARQGFNEFYSSWDNQQKQTQKQAVSRQTTMSSGISAITKKVVGLGAAYLGLRGIMSKIPEIGRTFKLAGDVMSRNFLWPLRQVLIPMLQKLLNWTRDHRIMFVRWGVHLANAFRVVVNLVKGVMRLVNRFVRSFINAFEGIFGKTVKRMGDLVNILMFKITAVAEFILVLMEPVMDKLGKLFAQTVAHASALFSGMSDGVGDAYKALSKISGAINRILGSIIQSKKETKAWMGVLHKVGQVIGVTLKVTIDAFTVAIDSLSVAVVTLMKGIKLAQAWYKGDKTGIKKLKIEFNDLFGDYINRTMKTGREGVEGVKGLFTGDKKELPAEPPKPPINVTPIKMRLPSTGDSRATNIHVDMGNMNITVTEGNAKEAGRNFGREVYDTIRQQLNNSMLGVPS